MGMFAIISTSLLILCIGANVSIAQEKQKQEKAAGRTVTVFVNNDRVKVYEGRFSPGEPSPQMSRLARGSGPSPSYIARVSRQGGM